VAWSHDAEVPVVQRDELGDAKALGDRHQAGVGCPQRQIGVPLQEIGRSVQISDGGFDDCEEPASKERRKAASTDAPASRARR